MQIKQLEVFAHVARLKSFSKAASALYLTQPTISAHMAALERDLGVRLVVRSTKELSLTPSGAVLEGYAAEILGLCQRAEQAARTAASDISGVLSIAASTVPSQYLLPQVLPVLRARYPSVRFQVRQGDSVQVAHWMGENGAELGIVGSPIRRPGLQCHHFLSERLVIVTPNTPRYAGLNGAMTADILRTAPFLVREAGSGTRQQADAFLRSIGVDPRALEIAAQLDSTESVLQGVKNGLGVAILSEYAAREGAGTGRMLRFDYDSPLLARQFYLLHHKRRPLSPAAAMLLDELPRFFSEEAGWNTPPSAQT